jgi:hypothetical protein
MKSISAITIKWKKNDVKWSEICNTINKVHMLLCIHDVHLKLSFMMYQCFIYAYWIISLLE